METKSNLFTHDFPTALAARGEPPCLWLYQPTHRHHPGNQQNPLRFRHLVKELEQSIEKKYPANKIHSLLEPFEEEALGEKLIGPRQTVASYGGTNSPPMWRF